MFLWVNYKSSRCQPFSRGKKNKHFSYTYFRSSVYVFCCLVKKSSIQPVCAFKLPLTSRDACCSVPVLQHKLKMRILTLHPSNVKMAALERLLTNPRAPTCGLTGRKHRIPGAQPAPASPSFLKDTSRSTFQLLRSCRAQKKKERRKSVVTENFNRALVIFFFYLFFFPPSACQILIESRCFQRPSKPNISPCTSDGWRQLCGCSIGVQKRSTMQPIMTKFMSGCCCFAKGVGGWWWGGGCWRGGRGRFQAGTTWNKMREEWFPNNNNNN